MAVGQAAHAVEAVLDGDEGLALQGPADDLDDIGGQMGEVAEGLVLDLAVLAEGTSQEVGFVDPVFVSPPRGGYMYSTASLAHAPKLWPYLRWMTLIP